MSSKVAQMEKTLLEKLNKEIEDHTKTEGKKMLEKKVEENLSRLDEESDARVKGLREKVKRGILKYQLNLNATVLFLLCLQLSVSFCLLLLMFLFSFILALLLIWVLMFVGCIYCGSYCLISKYPEHFKKSSSTFLMSLTLAICEGIVLCFMSMTVSSKVFLIEVSMIIVSLFMASMLAKCLKGKYKRNSGLMIAVMTTASMFILFFFLISSIRVWLTVCTILVCAYEWFLIFKVDSIIKELEEKQEEDRFQTGLYASLLIFKAKIDLFLMIFKMIGEKCCKKKQVEVTPV